MGDSKPTVVVTGISGNLGTRLLPPLPGFAVIAVDLTPPSTDLPLRFAIHKMEADKVVQQRAPALRGCSAYMLRPPIFAGASVENYMVGAFRGTPNGPSDRAAGMRSRGKRLPCLLPSGRRYLDNRIQ